ALAFAISWLDRWFSRRAAQFAAVLFALTPPGYTLLTTVAWGCHVETGMLAMVCLWLFLDLRDLPPGAAGRARRRFTLGACAGFSIWFHYESLIFLLVIFCFDAFGDRSLWRPREIGSQAAGLLLGALPWLVYNLRNDWAGL